MRECAVYKEHMAKRSIKKIKNMKIELPGNVRLIISELNKKGFEAFAVGGCVRDSLLGRTPGDWDITTSALPEDIKSVFRRTVDTGIEHGTVTVLIGGESYEVTTYRIDGEYKDSRHPSSVKFTNAVSEDLRRRDFTINAMAYNDKTGIIDLFGGCEDLKRGVIRCVGNADERFDEDALRILRAVRFAAQLDFDIDADTRNAVSTHAPRLKAVSKERVLVEISKLICSAHIEKAADIFQLGIVPYIAEHFREINIAQLMDLKRTALKTAAYQSYIDNELGTEEADEAGCREAGSADEAADENAAGCGSENAKDDELSENVPDSAFDLCSDTPTAYRYIRFALLTEGMSGKNVDAMLKALKADNVTRKNASLLAEHILKPIGSDAVEIKSTMSGMSPELFSALLRLKLLSSQSMLYKKECADEDICSLIDITNGFADREEPVYISELAVSGDDIKKCGAAEGPEIGRLLNAMLKEVWKNPEHNSREWLLSNMIGCK